jgi:Zn-dependent protease with chaperone function
VLGVAALDGLSLRAFKALIAHECGHFRHDGNAGGDLALSVRRSLDLAEAHMEENGISSSFNPAWWLVAGFREAFLRVSQGAVRLQEILADQRAAKAYGATELAAALSHTTRRAVVFEAHAEAVFAQVEEKKGPLHNVYTYELAEPLDEEELQAKVDKMMSPVPAPFESHPRPKERATWLAGMKVKGAAEEDAGPAWDLFGDREAIEEAMTVVLAKGRGVAVEEGEDAHDDEHEDEKSG